MKLKIEKGMATGEAERARLRLPVLCGADIELGNFVLGLERHNGTGDAASQALLREIEGLPLKESFRPMDCDCAACRKESGARKNSNGEMTGKGIIKSGGLKMGFGNFNPQDWGRKFLPGNGGCAYIDLDHLELCLPEVLSAYDHVACWHAMLLIARRAMAQANAKLPDGKKIQVLVNNTDGKGNSYGSHLDFLVSRRTWNNIFLRKIHYMLYLASFQVSGIILTGQGKVGSENGAAEVAFQLSQRADFFETLMAQQTTYNRPIVNSRDEPLCGRRKWREEEDDESETAEMARLHVIFFDNTLSHVASLLKVGTMQIVLAMIEAEQVNPDLILDDPVETVVSWSHDPTLTKSARLTDGREVTAIELQMLFLEEAKKFVAEGGCDGIVPRAEEIVALWEDTLLKLQAGDLASLAPRLDWVLKLSVLQQVMSKRPDLTWDAPQVKHLDHMYASLDEAEGLYWAYEKSGFVERVAPIERIERFVEHPPEDTRAWTRAALLSSIEPGVVDDVNWDFIRFKYRNADNRLIKRTLDLANPLAFTREQVEGLFQEAESLHELLNALGAPTEDKAPARSSMKSSWAASANTGPKALMSLFGNQLSAWREEPDSGRNGRGRPSSASDQGAIEDDEETIEGELEEIEDLENEN
jgi:proteasome accessory factor A